MKTIQSLKELKKLASGNGIEVSIMLNHGLRSSKFVQYVPNIRTWHIENYIDGTSTTKLSDTNIEEAINKKALKGGE